MEWKKLQAGLYESGQWSIAYQDGFLAGRYRWIIYRGNAFHDAAITLSAAKRIAEATPGALAFRAHAPVITQDLRMRKIGVYKGHQQRSKQMTTDQRIAEALKIAKARQAMEVVGIKLCNPTDHPSRYTYRVTFNGCILGDSRGYDKGRAIEEARKYVVRAPEFYTLDPEIGHGN
jgi:hypothetical protein